MAESVFDGVLIDDDNPSFALHSGGHSHVLFDVQRMLCNESDRHYILGVLDRRIAVLHRNSAPNYDILVGIETGGAILAAMLVAARDAWSHHVSFGVVRKDGTCSLPPATDGCRRAVLIDDVLTTNASMLAATNVLKQRGYAIVGSVCLIDRREHTPVSAPIGAATATRGEHNGGSG